MSTVLPFEGERPVRAEATDGAGGKTGLHLNDGTDLVLFATVLFASVETKKDARCHFLPRLAVEHAFDEGELTAFVKPGEDSTVDDGLAKFFNEIEDEGGFAGAVDVKEASEGFEASVHDGTPDMGGEDAIAVIESGVDGVGCALVGAAGEIESVGEHVLDFLPIHAAAGAFETHERVADLGGGCAFNGKGGTAEVAQGLGGGFERGAAVAVAALGEVAHEFFLVVQFAGNDPAAEVGTTSVIVGFHLGAAGFDGGSKHGRGDEGEGFAAGREEGDADAAFAEFFDEIGREADAAGGDDDFLEADEGHLGADGFVFADDDALGFLADEEAEAGDEELRAVFGGEEGDGVVFREEDVGVGVGRREREDELFGMYVEVAGDPVVLGEGGGFAEGGE